VAVQRVGTRRRRFGREQEHGRRHASEENEKTKKQTERRAVSPGETTRTAAPLNEEAKRKTAALSGEGTRERRKPRTLTLEHRNGPGFNTVEKNWMQLTDENRAGSRSEQNQTEIKALNTWRKISDLEPTQNKMQTRNISLRSKQSSHPIHGGLRPPSLFLIETKLAHF
jgi:hypothetical protein